jgi:hypothetical protein
MWGVMMLHVGCWMRAKAWVDVVHGMQTSSILGYCLLPMVLPLNPKP